MLARDLYRHRAGLIEQRTFCAAGVGLESRLKLGCNLFCEKRLCSALGVAVLIVNCVRIGYNSRFRHDSFNWVVTAL